MTDRIVLYTTHCTKCNILKQKLDEINITYEVVEDVNSMIEKGMTSAPALEIEENLLNFGGAMKWIENTKEGRI